MTRTDVSRVNVWNLYAYPNYPLGLDLLIKWTNKYINFNAINGTTGYWIRDNAWVVEFKDSWWAWGSLDNTIDIGDDVWWGTNDSVLFVDGWLLAQDNSNFTFNNATDTLYAKYTQTTGLALSWWTEWGVAFQWATYLTQDATKFFWDNTNKRLGIWTTTPSTELDVNGSINIATGEAYQQNSTDLIKIPSTGSNNLCVGDTGFTGAGNNNLLIGNNAGRLSVDAYGSTFVGWNAGEENEGGHYNTFLGEGAGRYQIYNNNVAIGRRALYGVTGISDGEHNLAIGNFALHGVTTGDDNVAIGYQAGIGVTTGYGNFLMGSIVGQNMTTGYQNVAIGHQAMSLGITTGYRNVCIGRYTGVDLTSGYSNCFIGGSGTGQNATEAIGNMGLGTDALTTLTTGDYNAAVGIGAGYTNSTWDDNTYLGRSAGYSGTGSDNVAIGAHAGRTYTGNGMVSIWYEAGRYFTGAENAFIGFESGKGISGSSTGTNNLGIGYRSLKVLTSGIGNMCFGSTSGTALTTWGFNVAIGNASMATATTSEHNVCIGDSTGSSLGADKTGNTFIGYRAGRSNTGSTNSFIGYRTGQRNLGDHNVFIGAYTGENSGNVDQKLIIWYGNAANQLIEWDFSARTLNINWQQEIISTAWQQLRLTHTDWVDEADFTVNSDGDLEIMPTSRTIYLGDGTAWDSTFGFYGETTVYTLTHDDSEWTLDLSANDVTNFSRFEADWTLEFNGTATVWKDINMGSAQLSRPTSSQPDLVTFVDENWADTGIQTYAFAVWEKVHGSFEMQHDYKQGSDFIFHVHWQGIAAPTGTDNVQWRLTYILMRDWTTLDAVTIIDSPDTTIATQYMAARSDFAAITGTNYLIGDQFLFTLERVAATWDAYAWDALIATAGLHYEIDTVGSRTTSTK